MSEKDPEKGFMDLSVWIRYRYWDGVEMIHASPGRSTIRLVTKEDLPNRIIQMLSTGIRDDNGREIYYEEESCDFPKPRPFNGFYIERIGIGNIYENPELLKSKQGNSSELNSPDK